VNSAALYYVWLTSRSLQVEIAASHGIIGLILYSDPADYSIDPDVPTFPDSWWLPGTGVQRGSVFAGLNGDPLTPNYPAIGLQLCLLRPGNTVNKPSSSEPWSTFKVISLIFSRNKCSLLFLIKLWHSRWPGVTFEGHFRYYKRFHCLSVKRAAYIMYEVNDNGRTSFVSNHFRCRIRWEGLL